MNDLVPLCIFGWPFALIGFFTFRMYLKHQAEMLDRKLVAQSQLSGQTNGEIAALRQELAQLRDTSTEYDVSIQHTLEELHKRLSSLELRNQYGGASPLTSEMRVEIAAGGREL